MQIYFQISFYIFQIWDSKVGPDCLCRRGKIDKYELSLTVWDRSFQKWDQSLQKWDQSLQKWDQLGQKWDQMLLGQNTVLSLLVWVGILGNSS